MNNLLFPHSFNPTPSEITEGCQGDLHPKAKEGIRLFNQGKYWHAHEALEQAWLEEPGPARALYKGILQAGTIYLQIERRNLRGAMKMYKRCRVWLWPWPDTCRGLNIGRLKADIEAVVNQVKDLGPNNLDQFDTDLFKPIKPV